MTTVYLAGGMRTNWQDTVMEHAPKFTYIDPRKHLLGTPEQYTVWDMHGIKLADIVFGYMEKDNPYGHGLAFEVGYALGLGKTVIVVDEKGDKYMAIVRQAAAYWCDDLSQGIAFLKSFERMF